MALFGGAPANASGTVTPEQAKLVASDAAKFDYFGASVSISGDTLVVGARIDGDAGPKSGSVYVFIRSGTTWTQQAKLTANDAVAGDQFGQSVAISGNTLVVGAHLADDKGSASGSAYVFVRSGSTWIQRAELSGSDTTANDRFGVDVAISGKTIVVGADGDDDAGSWSGSAYVFTRKGKNWSQQAKVKAKDAAAYDYFASSVAISGDSIVIGANRDDHAG
ncbi:MAG: FG-GAP repeat protein, partial [Acidimicrobiales bacterium]